MLRRRHEVDDHEDDASSIIGEVFLGIATLLALVVLGIIVWFIFLSVAVWLLPIIQRIFW